LIVSLETVHDSIKNLIKKSTKGDSRNITNIEALIQNESFKRNEQSVKIDELMTNMNSQILNQLEYSQERL
jgi:hypothetical protein